MQTFTTPLRVPPAPATDDTTAGLPGEPVDVRRWEPPVDSGEERTDPDALVEEHLPMADRLARRMTPGGYPNEDFVQVARLALVEAARRYEPSRRVPFACYASAVITGHLKHHLRDRCWAVRPPRKLQELWLEAVPARERLSQHLGRAPTVDEMAQELGVTSGQVVEALGAQNAWSADSFERLTAVPGRAWEPVESERGFDLIEDRSWLRPALDSLPSRLQTILELRFVHEMTQSEIAQRIGVSQMHVSRLLAKALGELRAAAAP
jgi:RNA polymerase sigma-B factor